MTIFMTRLGGAVSGSPVSSDRLSPSSRSDKPRQLAQRLQTEIDSAETFRRLEFRRSVERHGQRHFCPLGMIFKQCPCIGMLRTVLTPKQCVTNALFRVDLAVEMMVRVDGTVRPDHVEHPLAAAPQVYALG